MDEAAKNAFQFDPGHSAGQMLRSLREQAGVELEVLAAILKVPPQKLLALEEGELSTMPAYFARGLAANICRQLGADAAPVLAKMPDDKPHIATDDEAINAPFNQTRFGSSLRNQGVPSWALAGVGILGLAALVLFLYPTINAKLGARAAASAASSASAVASGAETAPAQTGTHTGAPVQLAPVPALAQPADAKAPASTTPQNLQPAPPASSPATPVAAPAASAVAASAAGLQVSATGDTWVQVRNKAGRTVYERTLNSGQTEQVPVDAYPVRVTIGRAENVQLTSRGQPFDLASVAKTGVARFTIQ